MSSFGFWNVKGCNDPLKIKELRRCILDNNLYLFSILETKVKAANELSHQRSLLQQWKFLCSYGSNNTRCIWICWDPSRCSVTLLDSNPQWIHCNVSVSQPSLSFYLTCVYGANEYTERRKLWSFMTLSAMTHRNSPWCIAGDFNAIRKPEDKKGGCTDWTHMDEEFNTCCNRTELEELRSVGFRFTWSNIQTANRILSKLDRVMVNSKWLEEFTNSEARILPPGISDHTPCLIHVLEQTKQRKIPFKFFSC